MHKLRFYLSVTHVPMTTVSSCRLGSSQRLFEQEAAFVQEIRTMPTLRICMIMYSELNMGKRHDEMDMP
jgi:hypothetical protein